ncbi:MAG: hypothetical protein C0497_00580 [Gemmatimonas sp.]|nr:hypothetical protein [Gemmatimonas sp.]
MVLKTRRLSFGALRPEVDDTARRGVYEQTAERGDRRDTGGTVFLTPDQAFDVMIDSRFLDG